VSCGSTAPGGADAGANAGTSPDAGTSATWTPSTTPLPGGVVQAIAVHPTDSSTLYAGTMSTTDSTLGSGVDQSTDFGATWSTELPAFAPARGPPLGAFSDTD
jgi:hypothetical protein